MSNFTPIEKLGEIARELKMREKVYKDWIKQGRLTLQKAEKQMAVMRAIAEDYRKEATEWEQSRHVEGGRG